MRATTHTLLLIFATFSGCNNFEDAEPTDRASLVRFYASGQNVEGTIAELDTDGGYIIAGNIVFNADQKDILIIKTDARGNKLWETVLKDGQVNSLNVFEQGYIIAGTRIQINREASEITEIVNTQARFVTMNKDGTIDPGNESFISQTVDVNGIELNVDYEANDLLFDEEGNLLILASQDSPQPGKFKKTIILSFSATSGNPTWLQDDYFLQDRDYVNCNSLQIAPNGNLLWATTAFLQQPGQSKQYLNIGFAPPNSTFDNADSFGENDARNHTAVDLQPSSIGYGVIGTYAQTNGSNGNIFFVRISNNGSIIDASPRYFDGTEILSADNLDQSVTEDQGNAITGTTDGGFVLAGNTTTENGDKDVLLIKLDAAGNMLWHQKLGGTGDERVSSIRETSDQGLLICGTNTVKGQSSIMLLKTDENGKVEN